MAPPNRFELHSAHALTRLHHFYRTAAPAGSARSLARNAVGVYNTHRSFWGSHTKTDNVDSAIDEDARQFAEQEAGLSATALGEEEGGAPVHKGRPLEMLCIAFM